MKEQDIRPAEIFEKYLELSRADAVTRFGDRSAWAAVPCPGCGHGEATESFVKDGFTYVECAACGSLFTSPRPSSKALEAFYGDSPSATYWAEVFFPASVAARREHIFAPRAERILQLMDQRQHPLGTVIDVGAGYGLFLEEVRKRRPTIRLLAVEPGTRLATICRQAGFETMQEPVERAGAWAGCGDVVTCFEVFEHVYSTISFASSLAALVAPGGYLVLTTLGIDGFDLQVLWEKSKSISPPHHLNFLSCGGFTRLFERAGFSDVEVLTPGRLDVDIVLNASRLDPTVVGSRFLRRLLDSEQHTRDAFQQFLVDHRLSSHTWVLARR